jgi:hypothetical protein
MILRGKKRPPEASDEVDDLFGGFQHHNLLTGGQTDDGVWGRLDLFDQIAVQHHGRVVEARNMDHDRLSSTISAVDLALSRRIYERSSEKTVEKAMKQPK